MSARADLTGQRFGRLTALRYSHSDGQRAHWLCQCDCGATATVRGHDLGKQTSCGCQKREHMRALKFKHGQRWSSPLYHCWLNMNDRCRNPKNKQFKDYGGRSVAVCDEWQSSFAAFSAYILAHLGERAPGMTLDRIDNDGNYEPGNVRWATRSVQRRNQRRMTHGDATEAQTETRTRAQAQAQA